MWRRWAIIAVLWTGLSGLLPAAMACAGDMPMPAQECCPGHEGCDDGPPAPAELECCAFELITAAVAQAAAEPAKRSAADFADDEPALATFALRASARPSSTHSPPEPAVRQFDQSDLWLVTARLRR